MCHWVVYARIMSYILLSIPFLTTVSILSPSFDHYCHGTDILQEVPITTPSSPSYLEITNSELLIYWSVWKLLHLHFDIQQLPKITSRKERFWRGNLLTTPLRRLDFVPPYCCGLALLELSFHLLKIHRLCRLFKDLLFPACLKVFLWVLPSL